VVLGDQYQRDFEKRRQGLGTGQKKWDSWTIGLTGKGWWRCGENGRFRLNVDSTVTPRIQEVHMTLGM
jgi:phosphoheptose isomerase